MVIYIGADHRGFELKNFLKQELANQGYEVADVGATELDPNDDYPAFARKVAEKVSVDFERARGVLLCKAGVGVSIVANKYPNVRAALVATPDQAYDSRTDDDSNILCLASGYTDRDMAKQILMTWIQTPFSGEERHVRRVKQIQEVELELAQTVAEQALATHEKLREDDDA